MAGYCSRWYRSASSLLFQKLSDRTRLSSLSETRTVSSTKPFCFFRIGSTFSLMVLASSRAFPDLGVTSTVRVNMENTPCACSEQATVALPVEADRQQWCLTWVESVLRPAA